MSKNLKKSNTRWPLVVYDVIVYIIASILLLWIYGGNGNLTNAGSLQLSIIGFVCIFICRMIGNIYRQIWRYGGIQGYIRLIFTDVSIPLSEVHAICYRSPHNPLKKSIFFKS